MFVNILPHESSCGQYLEYKKLDKYIFMIMFHTDDKSLPQIIISLPQIIISLPQMIIFVSHGLHRFTQIFFIRTITLSRGGQTSPPHFRGH